MSSRSKSPKWPGWGAYSGLAWQGTRMMLDAQTVIALRLAKIARGGAAAEAEAALMVNEKVAALMQSNTIAGKAALKSIQMGKSCNGAGHNSARQILSLYQRRVAANRRRLGGS